MRQPEIKEAVLRGAVPLQLYRVVADHAPEPRADAFPWGAGHGTLR